MNSVAREILIHASFLIPILSALYTASGTLGPLSATVASVVMVLSGCGLIALRLMLFSARRSNEDLRVKYSRAIRRIRSMEDSGGDTSIPVPPAANAPRPTPSRTRPVISTSAAEAAPGGDARFAAFDRIEPPIEWVAEARSSDVPVKPLIADPTLSDPSPPTFEVPVFGAAGPAPRGEGDALPARDAAPIPAPEDFETLFTTPILGVGHRIAEVMAAEEPAKAFDPVTMKIVDLEADRAAAFRVRFTVRGGGREAGVKEWMYMPVVEKLGQSSALDRLRLDMAEGLRAGAPQLFGEHPMIIDLSGASLADPTMAGDVVRRYARDDGAAKRVVLALPQRDVVKMTATQRGSCVRLRAAGLRLALRDIDDLRLDARNLAADGFRYLIFSTPEALRSFASAPRADLPGLLAALRGANVRAIVESVSGDADLSEMRALGVSMVSGLAAERLLLPARSPAAANVVTLSVVPEPRHRAIEPEADTVPYQEPLRRPA